MLCSLVVLIADTKNQVVKLEEDLRLFKAFLRESITKRRKDEKILEIVRQIRDLVYEAEDIIDTFVTQAADKRSSNYFSKAVKKPVNLFNIAKEVESIRSKVERIYGDKTKLEFAAFDLGEGDPARIQTPIVRQENIVGFDEEVKQFNGYMKEQQEQLDILSIIGMPGLGKTTLAGLIYRHPDIRYHFPTRIWVYISQEFTRKNVFLAILKEFATISDDMHRLSDEELAEKVKGHLQAGKFLIVMDDVWTTADWESLRIALPKENKTGKVLITSRHADVGRFVNLHRKPHMLRLLTDNEAWLLLRLEVFGKPEFPSDLEASGRLIVEGCANLPLAIVVIGGVLAKKDTGSMKSMWRDVSESVSTYLKEDTTKQMESIIALSYDKLPYHLRACFLYLGVFPEDFEIPVWKLTRMWIAEGFIQKISDISLEVIAESYLDDLINRNLVRVDKRRRDGRVKTCRVHDMLRDFCKNEAGNERENFLQEVKRKDGCFDPAVGEIQKFRRVCIHSNMWSFITYKPSVFGPCVRSFVCFSSEEINLQAENISTIPAAFKLLRVLEAKPLKFTKIPRDMYNLVHLRYIAISVTLDTLPTYFSKLWNIETLIVDTTSRTLDIKADIWKMIRLRHFKTNASATLPKPVKNSNEGEKIQTLGFISPQSCSEGAFDRARNVKKLGIRGKLAALLDAKTGSFDILGKLSNLEKLNLLNDVFPTPLSEGKLHTLPSPYQFPPKLRSLTLEDTHLDWTHMSILGLLENLEVLKLKDRAFMGRSWVASKLCFHNLEVLYIGRTDLVIWIASKQQFPRLRKLELKNCEELKQVPLELAEIPTFQMLELFRCKSAAASAKEIAEKKQSYPTAETNLFKLSIFPSEE